MVDPRREHQVLACREGRVHRRGGVAARVGQVEAVDRQRQPRRSAAAPAMARAAGLERWHHHQVVAGAVDVEERLLADDGGPGERRVRWMGPGPGRRGAVSHEHHVPAGARPALVVVAGEVLLLRAGGQLTVDDRVGDESPARPAAVVVEVEVALHVDPSQLRPLGGRPDVDVAIDVVPGNDGEVLGAAPEVAGRVVVPEPVGLGAHRAGDDHVVGRLAEAERLRVEPDLHVEVVLAGQEEVRVAARPELRGVLLRVDTVELALDGGHRHRRIEDQDVRAEVRRAAGRRRATARRRDGPARLAGDRGAPAAGRRGGGAAGGRPSASLSGPAGPAAAGGGPTGAAAAGRRRGGAGSPRRRASHRCQRERRHQREGSPEPRPVPSDAAAHSAPWMAL